MFLKSYVLKMRAGVFCCGLVFLTFGCPKTVLAEASGPSFGKAGQQARLEDEGRSLLRQGAYAEALKKFQKADAPELKLSGYQDTVAKFLIREAFQLLGEYEKALSVLEPLLQGNPTQENWKDEKLELNALIASRDSNSKRPLLGFIEFMKKRHQADMPPQRYNIAVTEFIDSAIIRAYDQMGDYDGGISYVDGILNYFKERDLKKYGKLRWGKADDAYLQVKLAFEQDKKEGKAGCMGQSGCVGRATKVLVQSDYFPW